MDDEKYDDLLKRSIIKNGNEATWWYAKNQSLSTILNNNKFYFDGMFKELCKESKNKSGIYMFTWKVQLPDKLVYAPVYIGKSNNLAYRLPTSFMSKFELLSCQNTYIDVYHMNKADAALAEMYFIGLWKPVFNNKEKYSDRLSIEIDIEKMCNMAYENIPVEKWYE